MLCRPSRPREGQPLHPIFPSASKSLGGNSIRFESRPAHVHKCCCLTMTGAGRARRRSHSRLDYCPARIDRAMQLCSRTSIVARCQPPDPGTRYRSLSSSKNRRSCIVKHPQRLRVLYRLRFESSGMERDARRPAPVIVKQQPLMNVAGAGIQPGWSSSERFLAERKDG